MKKLLLLPLILSGSAGASAQDIITRRDAEQIEAKVLRIDGKTIEYKKWENPDGPVYVIPSREVFTIRYENGSREVIHAWKNASRAQTDAGKFPRYQGEIALAYGVGVGKISDIFNTDRIVVESVHGVRVCPWFFAGAGVAFDLFYADMTAYDSHENRFGTYRSAGIVPVFTNLKGYYPVSDKCAFYLSLDLGAAIGVSGYMKDRATEFYTAVGPGINFGRKNGSARGDMSIRFQHMGPNLNAVLFRIGFGF